MSLAKNWHTITEVCHKSNAIAQNANEVSPWFIVKGAEGFNFWFYMESTGSPDVTLTAEISLLPPGWDDGSTSDLDPDSSDYTNYRSVQIKANETTQDAWQHYDTPSELNYPISHIRIRVTENNSGAVDMCHFLMAHN